MGGGSGFSGTPPTVAGSGSFYDETHNTTVITIPSVTVRAGQTLMVIAMISDDNAVTGATFLWNGLNPSGADESISGTPTRGGVYYGGLDVSSTATSNAVITVVNPFSTLVSCAALVVVVSNTSAPAMDPVIACSSFGTGSGTASTSSQDGTPSRVPAIAVAGNGTLGPLADSPGSWTDGFVDLDRTGTAGATDDKNSTISVGYRFLNGLNAVNVGKSGFTSREWAVIERPLKLR
jgi:hypothetical protein